VTFICCKQKAISEITTAPTFNSLKCDSQANPIAIESKHPLFSWIINADGFNRSQTAFQILVASNPYLLNEKDADLWNSNSIK